MRMLTCTISSLSSATFGRFSFEIIRILAFVILLISVIIAPPFPIRHPIREVGTSNRVVYEIRPESLSILSLHLGCNRNAASIAGENVSSNTYVHKQIQSHVVFFSLGLHKVT